MKLSQKKTGSGPFFIDGNQFVVFIILRIFRPLPGPALAWASVPQARRTVGHLGKDMFSHNWTTWAGTSLFFGTILDIRIYTSKYRFDLAADQPPPFLSVLVV